MLRAASRLVLRGPARARAFSNTGSSSSNEHKARIRATAYYAAAVVIGATGASFAAVPLYKMFCQATGYGGTTKKHDLDSDLSEMKPVRYRPLKVSFNADISTQMKWKFKPLQREISVVPGETALVFYTATNPTDQPIIGISTYNVIPFEAGPYFAKIQCFCFEEQRLEPGEEVDLPVLFYIDPEFVNDPLLAKVDHLTLSYTFFEAKAGESYQLPQPWQEHDRRHKAAASGGKRVLPPSAVVVSGVAKTTPTDDASAST